MAIEVRSKGITVATVSGRIGDFVFRTYEGGKMLVFYQPKRKKGKKVLSTMDREWTDNGPIMKALREITELLHLEIVGKV